MVDDLLELPPSLTLEHYLETLMRRPIDFRVVLHVLAILLEADQPMNLLLLQYVNELIKRILRISLPWSLNNGMAIPCPIGATGSAGGGGGCGNAIAAIIIVEMR